MLPPALSPAPGAECISEGARDTSSGDVGTSRGGDTAAVVLPSGVVQTWEVTWDRSEHAGLDLWGLGLRREGPMGGVHAGGTVLETGCDPLVSLSLALTSQGTLHTPTALK